MPFQKQLVISSFIFFTFFSENIIAQTKKVKIGLQFNSFYDYKVMHQNVTALFNFNKHNFYLGPQLTTILKPIYDPVDIYERNSFGFNAGYRYSITTKYEKLKPFVSIDFAIFKVKYLENQLGLPFTTKNNKMVLENRIHFGLTYLPFNKLFFNVGLGFGSYDGFFLLIDNFTPSSFIGIGYKF